MTVRANLIGRTFGRLTVIEFAGKHRNGNLQWSCKCSCGETKTAFTSNLIGGKTVSCGCKQTADRIKHGGIGTPEYNSWLKMKTRCKDESSSQWKDYGGRGVVVCERWQQFENFIADMGQMPGSGYTIERCENNGNYEPDNCRWATRKEQGRNRRNNHLLEYNGTILTISEWSEITGLRFGTIWDRINRGWSVENALLSPSNRGVNRA